MRILAVDPGETVGWVIFDTDSFDVMDHGEFEFTAGWPQSSLPLRLAQSCREHQIHRALIEIPVGQGITRPTMVATGIITGQIIGYLYAHGFKTENMPRYEIKKALRKATLGTIEINNDKSVRDALRLLFGEDCDRKGRKGTKKKEAVLPGIFGHVSGHEWAALALAVAWACGNVEGFLDNLLDSKKATK